MDNRLEITTVLLDLDGVIRHFDPARRERIEANAGLPLGALAATAFEETLIDRLVTGQISRARWVEHVGEMVNHPEAARDWLAEKGTVDTEMIAVIDELRDRGFTVAILTNGTDTIPAELDELGITPHVDAVFNTAEIGHAKPDTRAFEHVCAMLQVDPAEVFFTDDSQRSLGGAIALGMTTTLFTNVETLRHRLSEVLPADR